ncbi:ornithine carbamoyltransferase [Paenibacillus humicola]|uniref:ornithine carbamoyltransferase n=1 Tax=Paenibacillus humicola TaxID=3110540 RepID=UPI00237BBE83|nr:ornithine carbamoyltransferase [Paenibacillus humicola]
MNNLLSLKELREDDLYTLIHNGLAVKQQPKKYEEACRNIGILMLFQKTSTRTHLSFHAGIHQMGGYATVMDWDSSNFSISPISHEARYASRNCSLIMARLKKHEDLLQLAEYSSVPVINGCCDKYHPCQALADLMTIYETAGTFEGITLTYVGIHNNVANSLIAGCLTLGMQLQLVTPIVHEAARDEELMRAAAASGHIRRVDNLDEALSRTDFVYTDTWVDMEFVNSPEYEEEKRRRIRTMLPYQLKAELFSNRKPYVMHDMPIHPGYEIEEQLIESEQSIIFRQADNRLHVQKALMLSLLQK